jgi:hypothetical protein
MKKYLPFCLALTFFVLASSSYSQAPTPSGATSDATNKKIHRLDLLIKLLPLVIQKAQYPVILAGIDKARDLEKEEKAKEDTALAEMEPSVSDAVDNGIQKGIYPPKDLQQSISDQIRKLNFQQIKVGAEMIKTVYDTIESSLNDGQRKTMEGSFSNEFISPTSPSTVTDDVKLRFYVKAVFLDEDAYDLISEMAKHAS